MSLLTTDPKWWGRRRWGGIIPEDHDVPVPRPDPTPHLVEAVVVATSQPVFLDADGSGTQGGSELALSDMLVRFTRAGYRERSALTVGSSPALVNIEPGVWTVTVATPAGHYCTTGNNPQQVTVTAPGPTVAPSVGFRRFPPEPVSTYASIRSPQHHNVVDAGPVDITWTIGDLSSTLTAMAIFLDGVQVFSAAASGTFTNGSTTITVPPHWATKDVALHTVTLRATSARFQTAETSIIIEVLPS